MESGEDLGRRLHVNVKPRVAKRLIFQSFAREIDNFPPDRARFGQNISVVCFVSVQAVENLLGVLSEPWRCAAICDRSAR